MGKKGDLLRQQKKQELGMFLDKAEKNGWDVSKNGDREFLETVFKTPGMERVAAGIRTKRLQDELPAADKLIFTGQAESVVSNKNMQYSSEMRERSNLSKMSSNSRIGLRLL